MARVNQTVSDEVVRYRKVLAALRDVDLQVIDAEVWGEYMTNHPLEKEPDYLKDRSKTDD